MFPVRHLLLLQEKTINRNAERGSSGLDSPKTSQSVPKVEKSSSQQQEEDKLPKKDNRKAKESSAKPLNHKPEARTKEKSASTFLKKSKDKSPLAPASSTTTTTITTTGRTTTKRFPLKQKIRAVNIKALQLPNINNPSQGIKDLEIRLLQVECEELKNRLGCLREGLVGQKPSDMEDLLKQSQKELLWLQRQLSFISTGGPACILSTSKFLTFELKVQKSFQDTLSINLKSSNGISSDMSECFAYQIHAENMFGRAERLRVISKDKFM
ncbi:PREDICTED: uncharacterized protein LOC109290238 [Gavialis gangeticus]|uniref:uncharacterized protein LOC109290238 n=1 Tax=Gavialis gangeticus TaxID=94835 RepID=UPI00092F144F|nr:PREDICTED: uncharacterized protein LOC109290238 [Gavialis gangeticus]